MADEQESEPPTAVLHTVELPAFDSSTGQLTLAAHHLISSPLSYAASFAPEYTLLLGTPPARPYQTPEPSEAAGPTSRRKRRRLAPTATEATPADWARTREEESRKSTTDRETEVHHAAIVDGLASAIEAVREGWKDAGGVGWAGDVGKSVEWVDNGAHVGLEVDLVGVATQTAPDTVAEPLLLDAENDQQLVELRSLFCRLVCNTTNFWREVQTVSLPREEEAQPSPISFRFVLPPSSAFLLSDFITWSDPSSGISRLGRKHGGWDLLLLEYVSRSSPCVSSPLV